MFGDDLDQTVKCHLSLFHVRIVKEDMKLPRQAGQLKVGVCLKDIFLELLKSCIVTWHLDV